MASWLHKAYWNAFTLWHARGEERLPYLPLEDILSIQSRRVRSIMSHAYATVPYYRRVMDEAGLRPGDFQTAGDLPKLPILTGEQLARAPEQFLSSRYTGGRSLALYSSGTLGRRKTIYYDPAAIFLCLAHGHRQRRILARFVGRTFGYREMTVFRANSQDATLRAFYEANSWVPRGLDLERSRMLAAGRLEDAVQRINAFRPDVIFGYGSYLGTVFRWAWEHNVRLHRPKAIWYGSDQLAPADRRLIETEFGAPVFSTYQATEVLRIAFQCEQRAGFHLNLDHVAVRIVDGDGRAVGPGETGEIVISNLTNRATVLLNYKLGDVVTRGRSECPCGRSLPTVERIDGRADDLLVRPDNQVIHSAVVVAPLLAVPGVVRVQLVQSDPRHFSLRAVCAGGAGWGQVRPALDATLRSVLGDDIVATLEQVDAIPPEPGGKVRTIISHCTAASPASPDENRS